MQVGYWVYVYDTNPVQKNTFIYRQMYDPVSTKQ